MKFLDFVFSSFPFLFSISMFLSGSVDTAHTNYASAQTLGPAERSEKNPFSFCFSTEDMNIFSYLNLREITLIYQQI